MRRNKLATIFKQRDYINSYILSNVKDKDKKLVVDNCFNDLYDVFSGFKDMVFEAEVEGNKLDTEKLIEIVRDIIELSLKTGYDLELPRILNNAMYKNITDENVFETLIFYSKHRQLNDPFPEFTTDENRIKRTYLSILGSMLMYITITYYKN